MDIYVFAAAARRSGGGGGPINPSRVWRRLLVVYVPGSACAWSESRSWNEHGSLWERFELESNYNIFSDDPLNER